MPFQSRPEPFSGLANAPVWLDTDWLLVQFGSNRKAATKAYRAFVMEGRSLPSSLSCFRHQLLLGDDGFVERYKQDNRPEELRELSKAHRRSLALSLEDYRGRHRSRDEVMAHAYRSGAYTMGQIGRRFNVHYMTVSRAVRKFEGIKWRQKGSGLDPCLLSQDLTPFRCPSRPTEIEMPQFSKPLQVGGTI